jgi:formylglycine-generating enzyme required for sulfatase activity
VADASMRPGRGERERARRSATAQAMTLSSGTRRRTVVGLRVMKRLISIVVALAACGKKPDAAQTDNDKTHVADQRSSQEEPKVAPPPPTTKPNDKGDCKLEYAPRPKRDPNPMCKIAGGTFVMGEESNNKAVKLSPYYMDEFEVTNAQVLHYLRTTGADDRCPSEKGTMQQSCLLVSNSSPIQKQSDGSYVLESGTERRPFEFASREGAMQYCAWAGKALPTEAQWEFAARHDPATNQDYKWPWGDTFDGQRARCFQKDCPGTSSSDTTEVGSYDGTNGHGDGRSPWGVHDMAGNVNELVADCLKDYVPCEGPCVDPPAVTVSAAGEQCVIIARGGGVTSQRKLRTFDRSMSSSGGFRCARPMS